MKDIKVKASFATLGIVFLLSANNLLHSLPNIALNTNLCLSAMERLTN